MTNITRDEQLKEQYRMYVSQGDWESVFEESVVSMPIERRRLLWDILMEADWEDYNQLEDMIYSYGSQLGAKDHLGRWLFVRMAMMLRRMHSQ